MKEFGHQAVVWQTAVMPAVAIELLANGPWNGAGVVGPEALPSEPFLDLLDQHGVEWDFAEYWERRRPRKARRPPRPHSAVGAWHPCNPGWACRGAGCLAPASEPSPVSGTQRSNEFRPCSTGCRTPRGAAVQPPARRVA